MSEKLEINGLSIEIHDRTELDVVQKVELTKGEFWFESGDTTWTVNGFTEQSIWPKSCLVLNCMITLPEGVKTDTPTSWHINNTQHGKELVKVEGMIYAPELIDAFYGKYVADYIRANRIKPFPSVLR